MAGVTFSEQEVKKLILALAGSKAAPEPEDDDKPEEKDEKPEEKPEVDSEDSAGKPFKESTRDMLKRKLEEKKDA